MIIDFYKSNLFTRSQKARIKFNTYAFEWSKCMETCPKYNRALAPTFNDQKELEELIKWTYNVTTDPITNTFYEDGFGRAIWLPFRWKKLFLHLLILFQN